MEAALQEQFVRLLTKHQDALFRYIFALLPHEADARDVLQETSVALNRKFAEYDAARPFASWAYKFAYLEVLKHRERSRRLIPPMDVETLALLAKERDEEDGPLQARLQALTHCLEKLPPTDRQLIQARYSKQFQADELAGRTGQSRRTLFRNLERIRHLLMHCIDRQGEG
jgi:RNA polymerase sigma-70 factor, ECF subfamily